MKEGRARFTAGRKVKIVTRMIMCLVRLICAPETWPINFDLCCYFLNKIQVKRSQIGRKKKVFTRMIVCLVELI